MTFTRSAGLKLLLALAFFCALLLPAAPVLLFCREQLRTGAADFAAAFNPEFRSAWLNGLVLVFATALGGGWLGLRLRRGAGYPFRALTLTLSQRERGEKGAWSLRERDRGTDSWRAGEACPLPSEPSGEEARRPGGLEELMARSEGLLLAACLVMPRFLWAIGWQTIFPVHVPKMLVAIAAAIPFVAAGVALIDAAIGLPLFRQRLATALLLSVTSLSDAALGMGLKWETPASLILHKAAAEADGAAAAWQSAALLSFWSGAVFLVFLFQPGAKEKPDRAQPKAGKALFFILLALIALPLGGLLWKAPGISNALWNALPRILASTFFHGTIAAAIATLGAICLQTCGRQAPAWQRLAEWALIIWPALIWTTSILLLRQVYRTEYDFPLRSAFTIGILLGIKNAGVSSLLLTCVPGLSQRWLIFFGMVFLVSQTEVGMMAPLLGVNEESALVLAARLAEYGRPDLAAALGCLFFLGLAAVLIAASRPSNKGAA